MLRVPALPASNRSSRAGIDRMPQVRIDSTPSAVLSTLVEPAHSYTIPIPS